MDTLILARRVYSFRRNSLGEVARGLRVRIDRQKAALFGFSTSAIGAALKTAYNGLDVTTYYEGDEDYDITVTLGEADRRVTDDGRAPRGYWVAGPDEPRPARVPALDGLRGALGGQALVPDGAALPDYHHAVA